MKFSIIIPVYNTELYVEKCIRSCMNQDIDASEYEIIVINDGSTDKSLQKIESLITGQHNIKLISQQNQGQSVARNIGLKIAKGEYIWFVDSDDWIENNCINNLFFQCKEHKLDMLSIEFNDLINGSYTSRNFYKKNSDKFEQGKIYMTTNEIQLSPCCYIFRRNFLITNNLFFLNNIYHEDNELIPRAFYIAERFMTNSKALYFIFPNPTSTTRSIIPKKSFDLLKVAQSHVDFIDKFVHEEEIKTVFYNCIGLAINSALNNMKIMNTENKQKFYSELKHNKHLFIYMRRSNKLKYKLEALLYLLSPLIFKKSYSIFS